MFKIVIVLGELNLWLCDYLLVPNKVFLLKNSLSDSNETI